MQVSTAIRLGDYTNIVARVKAVEDVTSTDDERLSQLAALTAAVLSRPLTDFFPNGLSAVGVPTLEDLSEAAYFATASKRLLTTCPLGMARLQMMFDKCVRCLRAVSSSVSHPPPTLQRLAHGAACSVEGTDAAL